MNDEVELAIVGVVTDGVKRALLENLNALKSKGVKRISLRVFTRNAPLKYLEGLREVLLANMVTSIRVYEHDLGELHNTLKQLVKGGKEVIVTSGEEPLKSQVLGMLSNLKSEE
jgi:hypothetical protein